MSYFLLAVELAVTMWLSYVAWLRLVNPCVQAEDSWTGSLVVNPKDNKGRLPLPI